MKSSYSRAIWHLMQLEMHSHKPILTNVIQINFSLEEIKEITGTKKIERLSQLKEKVFEKTLRKIDENGGVKVTYENIKRGRTVINFGCSVVSMVHIDESKIPQKVKDRTRLEKLRIERKQRELTLEE